jgi:glycine/D-amino acid oxidase-like deaminating enzyme
MNRSYWDLALLPEKTQTAIIGSGIVGLSAAICLRKAHPNMEVVVFEQGITPSGASTKNAGFACFGSVSEILDDLETLGEDEVRQLIKRRWNGLHKLRQITTGYDIGLEQHGGYEIFTSKLLPLFEQCDEVIERINNLVHPVFGEEVFRHAHHKAGLFGLKDVVRVIENPLEAQLDAGKLMIALTDIARKFGVKIYTGCRVTLVEERSKGVILQINEMTEIVSDKVLVATNGFARNLLPDLEVWPTRAQVLITEPIEGLKLKGTFHMDRGYTYFRNIDQRILLGGMRNIDKAQEYTTDTGTSEIIQGALEALLNQHIISEQKVKIAMRWTGLMGTGPSRSPIVEMISDRVGLAVRLGGMGIAIGSLVGEEAALMLTRD